MRRIDLQDFDKKGFYEKYGPWAVVAGASEGAGLCYAELLAAMGFNLVLISRRLHLLTEVGSRLSSQHGVEFRAVVADLKAAGAGNRLDEATADLDVGLYISNAGTDGSGNSFLAAPVERSHDLIAMNVTTLVDAVHRFGRRMKARGSGGFVIMSSCAGLGGQPFLAMYSGTKAFEMNFAESLWAEFKADNIDVLAVGAPGMDTPTLRRAAGDSNFDFDLTYDPAEVVHAAFSKLGNDPVVIFPDGPDFDEIPKIQAGRIARVVALAEWAKSYTAHLHEEQH
jgi:short-subunit dehydrogenase